MEFEFYLADRLKKTVGELRAMMGNDEYIEWYGYHTKRSMTQQANQMAAESKGRGRAG